MKIPKPLTRLTEYTVAGTTATIADFLLLIFFTEIIGLFYAISAAISFFLAHTLNYIINKEWGFKDTKLSIKKSYTYFLIFGIIIAIITSLSMVLLVEKFNFNYIASKAIIVVILGTINFILNYTISFGMGKEFFKFFKK